MENRFDDFTNLYQVSKTLRFEAQPEEDTMEKLASSKILDNDKRRAKSYVTMKKLIDEFHKAYIDHSLENGALEYTNEGKDCSLQEYASLYAMAEKDEKSRKAFDEVKANLRKAICKKLNVGLEALFKKELITEKLPAFIAEATQQQLLSMSKEEAQSLIEKFKTFTTYFSGFNTNRKNMYAADDKSTGIAYRLINDNLPKFMDNMKAFVTILDVPGMRENMERLYEEMKEYLNVASINEIFSLDYYNMLLTQKQIEVYNAIIGGRVDRPETKIKGINEYVNLYNQQHKDARLPKLKMLFKQILSDREAISWLPERFGDDQSLLKAVGACYNDLNENVLGDKLLKSLLENLEAYNTEGIYISNDLQLSNLSQKVYGSWSAITSAIMNDKKQSVSQKKKETPEAYEKRIFGIVKKADSFSIAYIDSCMQQSGEAMTIEAYYAKLGAVDTPTQKEENIFAQIANAYTKVKPLLDDKTRQGNTLPQESENVDKLKQLLDSLKALQRYVKPLLGAGDESDKDERFYGELSVLWQELDMVTPLYNMVRNYVTQKPYSTEKLKVNFDNYQLMAGWDKNKEADCSAIILRRKGLYYLGIMSMADKKTLKNEMPKPKPEPGNDDCYEKMVYKYLPGANKQFPKCFISAKDAKTKYGLTDDMLAKYNAGTHKKGDTFNLDDCRALIDYFKQAINKCEWKDFGFEFSDTATYEDISGFYREVDSQAYKVRFQPVSVEHIKDLVNKGQMFLFKIYNKDFSEHSHGTPNMHTLYWKELFEERNLSDVVYQLCGGAEFFFREKSLTCKTTHPQGVSIKNKNELNPKKESVFNYELVKNRRYTVDKMLFHVPIKLNFKSAGREDINEMVRQYLHDADDVHIIGIDRGERHLLYLTVIDLQGNIKEQTSLNEIVNSCNGTTICTDYHKLLDNREGERQEARQNWKNIEGIKDLKSGYLSQVVHQIAQRMVKYHAIVVLEDLNIGFMRGRQKVEKQVYQDFEKKLIEKLNYLVDKNIDPDLPGGLRHAYQLASKFDSFQKLHAQKQSGFLFYVPAWKTSKIDPVTGFVNLFDTRYKNVEQARRFFSHFDTIRYNDEKQWYEFAFDYINFGIKADGTRTRWTLCTYGKRIKTFRDPEKNNEWKSKEVDLTEQFTELFEKKKIDIHCNLKEAIAKQSESKFLEGLLQALRLTLQMRNSMTGTEVDYIVSPVADDNGHFYDSNNKDASLPENADANGAYNIARKGLMMIQQIKAADSVTKMSYDLTNKNWLNFAQKKPYTESL